MILIDFNQKIFDFSVKFFYMGRKERKLESNELSLTILSTMLFVAVIRFFLKLRITK